MTALKRTKLWAFAFLAFSLLLDQFTKQWIINIADGLHPQFLMEVTSFFDLVLVWNRGISFGMLANHPDWMPWILTIGTSILTLILAVWFYRTPRALTVWALAFVISGAIGNIIDRLRFGAVVDFLDFHIDTMHWPAFNVADSMIFIGVVLLMWESIVEAREEKQKEAQSNDAS